MVEIKIPKLGLTMESARLVRWECRSGEEVREGDIVLVIETDKVTYEVPAPATGIVVHVALEGKNCAVEEIAGYIAGDWEEYRSLTRRYPGPQEAAAPTGEKPSDEEEAHPEQEDPALRSGKTPSPRRIKASPLARSMAKAHDLNLADIPGSGPGGRIVRADILRVLGQAKPAGEISHKGAPPEEAGFPGKEAAETIPIQGARRVIFENMQNSLRHSAQLSLHTEARANSLVALRNRLKRGGSKVSYNSILIKAAATALRRHPGINSSVEQEEIRIWKQIHIGLAMEARETLMVPVVRSPDTKTITRIDEEIEELLQKMSRSEISPDDLAGGTFTITNLGFADIDYFTPIIRPPESAILGVGRIVQEPVARDGEIAAEARIGLSLTFDHRIIDGAPAARFLKTIKDMIEDPLLMLG